MNFNSWQDRLDISTDKAGVLSYAARRPFFVSVSKSPVGSRENYRPGKP